MDKIKGQLAGVAALLGVIPAIGGGFVKYGEITTKLDALSEVSAPDLTPIAQSIGSANTDIAILKTELELLKLQIEEIKVSTKNPLE